MFATPSPEIIAVLPDGAPRETGAEFVATGTMVLVRYADGRLALEPVRTQTAWRGSSTALRSKPIFDPASREVMGYEMELAAC